MRISFIQVLEILQIKKIKKKYFLNEANFVPNGTTALLDAIGSTINSVDARIEKHAVKPGVIIAIITDGHENSSRFYTQNNIKKTIKKRSDKNNWNFMYLGANQDAIFEGNRIGISSDYSHNFKASKVGVEIAFNNVIKESMKLSRNHLQANLQTSFYKLLFFFPIAQLNR